LGHEIEIHVHKITNVPVLLWVVDLMIFDGGQIHYSTFLGPKWHSLRSLPFQGPKKSRFSGTTRSKGPYNGIARFKSLRPATFKQQVQIELFMFQDS
jgi:hypothetical protein